MSELLRAGIIGCGGISTMHAGNYASSTSARLVAAADISQPALERFAGRNQGINTYLSYEEMLEREKLDLVSICTPPAFHLEPALAAARAAVPGLLLEKPMALNLRDADLILAECREHGVKLAIGHQLRCFAAYLAGREMLLSGRIGQIERIWGVCHGAPLQTNATHTIDLMRYLAGDLPVDWVMGSLDAGSGRRVEGIRQEDAAAGIFQFHNGPAALIESGDLAPRQGYHHILVDGTGGQVELTRPGGPALRFRSAATSGEWQTPELPQDLNPIDDLVEAIRTGGEARASGHQGRATLEIILALFESARTLRRVALPLANLENPLDQIYQAECP